MNGVLNSLSTSITNLAGERIRNYLISRKIPYALSVLLILGFLYQQLTGILFKKVPIEYSRLIIYSLLICLAILIFKFPRFIYYLAIFSVLIIHLFYFTQFISNQNQDQNSSRDEAVELTTKALISGKNPWNNVPDLDVPATTGPASILFAIPAVLIFGKINILTFLFWVLFFCVLLLGDISKENNTFPLLVLLFVAGIFEFSHTLFWSLDELYYPYLLIPIAFWSTLRKRWILVGIILAITILFRLSYLFVVIGFLLWFFFNESYQLKDLLKVALGFVITGLIVLIPFIIIGGQDFLSHNPFIYALAIADSASLPGNNILYQGLNYFGSSFGLRWFQFVKLVIILGIMFLITLSLRSIRHPYWHITAGAFLAQTVAWVSLQFPKDYELFFILPMFLAISSTNKKKVL